MWKEFIVGSSLVSFIITFTYTGIAFSRSGRPSSVPYELIAIFVPLLFGLTNIINMIMVEKYGTQVSFLIGALFGLGLSLTGRFLLNLPTKIFHFNRESEYQVHIIAPIIYALVFRYIITPISVKLK